jgi:hypothetical protein
MVGVEPACATGALAATSAGRKGADKDRRCAPYAATNRPDDSERIWSPKEAAEP